MVDCNSCEYLGNNKCTIGVFDAKRPDVGQLSSPPKECSHFVEKFTVKEIEGKKYDEGKNRMGLVLQGFSNALWEVGRVGTFGCQKYGENSWQKLDNAKSRYLDALCRHLFKHLQGEKVDDESGLLHLSHLAWNTLCLLEFELKDTMEFGTEKGLQQACDMAKKFLYETESEEENEA